MKPKSKFSKPLFHSVKPLRNNYMLNDSCTLLRDFNHSHAQDHGAGEVSTKDIVNVLYVKRIFFFTYSTFTISCRNFLGNRESFFVSCYRKQFACTLCMK